MTHKIQLDDLTTEGRNTLDVDEFPNECPICHNKIRPHYHNGFLRRARYSREAQLIFLCPVDGCRSVFIGYYQERTSAQRTTYFALSHCEPKQVEPVVFSDIINQTSLSFSNIYNQAYTAEEKGLKDICGAGYRKSLEFLIKDYLISRDASVSEAVKKEQLGVVIQNRVTHAQLKEVARRATWLGNDETHYERRWNDMELKDLKILIDLAVRWIEMDKMTDQAIADMPEKDKQNDI